MTETIAEVVWYWGRFDSKNTAADLARPSRKPEARTAEGCRTLCAFHFQMTHVSYHFNDSRPNPNSCVIADHVSASTCVFSRLLLMS